VTLVLGIDPASTCGWALVSHPHGLTANRVASGIFRLARTGDAPGAKFVRLVDALDDLEERNGRPSVVAYELPGLFRSSAAALSVWGIVAHVLAWAERRKIPTVAVPISTVKRRATGTGKATGDQTIEWASRRFRCSPATDDEAEALIVALLGLPILRASDPAAVF